MYIKLMYILILISKKRQYSQNVSIPSLLVLNLWILFEDARVLRWFLLFPFFLFLKGLKFCFFFFNNIFQELIIQGEKIAVTVNFRRKQVSC